MKLVTEFVGTFFLVLTIGLVVAAGGQPVAVLAIGLVLAAMIYMGGHVSGAHYNPAVSLAALIRGGLPAVDFVGYMVAQLAGGVLAGLVAAWLTGKAIAPDPGANVDAARALVVEALFTFALALTVLNVATSKKTQGNSFYGLAIGLVVVAGALAGGGISGGAFNPAVGVGLSLSRMIAAHGSMANSWIYVVGPFVGGAAAAGVFLAQEASHDKYEKFKARDEA